MFGCNRDQFMGKSPVDFSPDKQYDGRQSQHVAREKIQRVMSGESQHFAWLHQKLDGSLFDAEVTLNEISVEGKDLLLAIVRDVTERRRTQHELFIKERAMEAAIEGIVLTDASADNQVLYANKAMETITGYTCDELFGQNMRMLQGKETDRASIMKMHEAIASKKACKIDILNYRKDGTEFWNEISITPVTNQAGDVTHFIGTQQDITEKRKTESALHQSQKMDAIGQLACGIAHDFNNKLGIAIGYLDFLRDSVKNQERETRWIDITTSAIERCTKLTQQLLSFSREKENQALPTNINNELEKMKPLIESALTPAIKYEINLTENPQLVNINPDEFQDALLNLVINARDAMADGGNLTVETRQQYIDKALANAFPSLQEGDYFEITVNDTGSGIDSSLHERIFEPFFTTKQEDKGTGLGLAMVYGFVKRNNGDIMLMSEPGQGATFKIFLPVIAEHKGTSPDDMSELDALPQGHESILVVDDENDLLNLAQQYLSSLGYQVFTATNPAEALEVLAKRPKIDLLFSDVIMPGDRNGYTLADEVLERYPYVKILLTSGLSGNADPNSRKQWLTETLLSKPYQKQDLALKVRDILDSPSKPELMH
jgi:PAS domain S-box-containing protein